MIHVTTALVLALNKVSVDGLHFVATAEAVYSETWRRSVRPSRRFFWMCVRLIETLGNGLVRRGVSRLREITVMKEE
jgi:hypothetical protein